MNPNLRTAQRALLGYAMAMALASGLVTSNAQADEPVRSETVKFADLNLNTTAGAEALYTRIHAAAWRLCEQPAGEQAATARCMSKTESDAIGKVNAPLLTAFYQKKTGTSPQTITANR
jgi:UrcA family protein